jgi:dihydroxyacid dehydratase/phosphogluconate dehydratase
LRFANVSGEHCELRVEDGYWFEDAGDARCWMNAPLNWNSRHYTRGWQRGVTAFYYGLGLTDEDFDKPQIGIGVPLLDGNLCNLHAYELARRSPTVAARRA